MSVYDTTNSKAVIAIVNVGGSFNNDNTLSADDCVNADVAVVAVVGMSLVDYAAFGANQLAAAL